MNTQQGSGQHPAALSPVPSRASMNTLWWMQATPIGDVVVVSGDDGVHRIWFGASDNGAIETGAIETAAIVGSARAGRDRTVARQLDEWFAGSRRRFSLAVAWPADLSPFGRAVLETLAERVPWGETVSYGELAELAGKARAARAVGRIMSANPVPFIVPCHRVIAAGGRIGGYGGGRDAIELKHRLLQREGVYLRGRSPVAREVAIPSNP
jgi:methylated-DNA-[protein]-cysteine S-methyltransferase